MKTFLAAALLFGAAAGLSAQAVRFVVGEWAPYTGPALAGNGMAVELVAAACRAAGLSASFEFGPWKRDEAAVADGSAFATFPYAETPERRGRFLFSDPLFRSSFAVLLRSDNPVTKGFRFVTNDSFRGFRVGITSGTDAVRLPLERAGAAVEETATLDQSLKKLALGRLDFVIDDRAVVAAGLRTAVPSEDASAFVLLGKPFGETTSFRVMATVKTAGASAVLQRFNAGLAKSLAEGTAGRILARYGFSPP